MSTPSYLVATLIAAGGAIGYISKGSVISLGMGLTFAAIIGYGGYQIPSRNGYLITISMY